MERIVGAREVGAVGKHVGRDGDPDKGSRRREGIAPDRFALEPGHPGDSLGGDSAGPGGEKHGLQRSLTVPGHHAVDVAEEVRIPGMLQVETDEVAAGADVQAETDPLDRPGDPQRGLALRGERHGDAGEEVVLLGASREELLEELVEDAAPLERLQQAPARKEVAQTRVEHARGGEVHRLRKAGGTIYQRERRGERDVGEADPQEALLFRLENRRSKSPHRVAPHRRGCAAQALPRVDGFVRNPAL